MSKVGGTAGVGKRHCSMPKRFFSQGKTPGRGVSFFLMLLRAPGQCRKKGSASLHQTVSPHVQQGALELAGRGMLGELEALESSEGGWQARGVGVKGLVGPLPLP